MNIRQFSKFTQHSRCSQTNLGRLHAAPVLATQLHGRLHMVVALRW
jgi:hypothetical protein